MIPADQVEGGLDDGQFAVEGLARVMDVLEVGHAGLGKKKFGAPSAPGQHTLLDERLGKNMSRFLLPCDFTIKKVQIFA
jgi:hypothetical protein